MRGLFDWKLIVTGLVLAALLVLGFSFGPFADVAASFSEKIGPPPQEVERNVSFIVQGDPAPLALSGAGMGVAVMGRFSGTAKDSVINTSSPVMISGFRGTIAVDNRQARLSGRYKKLAVRDVVFAEGPLEAVASFSSLEASNVTLGRLALNTTLTLAVNGVETSLSGKTVILHDVKGTVVFGDAMRIAGNASAILVPDIGMQIGAPPQ